MKNKPSFTRIYFVLIFNILLFFSVQIAVAQVQWRPITQAELDMKTPKVEPDADAEAIFWEVRLDDKKDSKMFYNHYVRVKIFTERGRERFSKFDIPFIKGKKVEEVAARVIKPDGTITELQPSDIFEREIFKAGKISVKAKSFAVPNIEPGVIVEYQYKETIKNDSASGEILSFQRDIPMQKVVYSVRPYKGSTLNFSYKNMPEMRFLLNNDGFYVGTRENVPAFKEEPQMPPDSEVRQTVSLSYDSFSSFRWSFFGNPVGIGFDEIIKPNKEIEQKARELTANAENDEEKLKNLFNFVRSQIKNITFDKSLTDVQREDFKKNKKASDTLKRGIGDAADVDILFASLAKSIGFDVNMMFSGDRSENFFNPERNSGMRFIHRSGIAVRQGNLWKPYNPGTPFMPFGMVDWYEENVYTMIAGGGGYSWIRLPMTDYTKNISKRTGKFKLLEDGTLEGTIKVEHYGQQATLRRRDLFEKSPNEREESVKKGWKDIISAAEISAISIENFDDSSKPYSYSFTVRVPNYAQKTGKRLFLQPEFFEYGTNPLFSSATRKYGIYFEFPWSQSDNIEIELPKNFELDNADVPAAIADPEKIGSSQINMAIDKKTNTLKYKREFHFGGGGNIIFPVEAYQPIKKMFDAFHTADMHTISLKQKQ
jgi:Domain of Unknown Function with PDB structure (DUF3857)/Transglutaminase-like superfamily